jgi:hypothetical protein
MAPTTLSKRSSGNPTGFANVNAPTYFSIPSIRQSTLSSDEPDFGRITRKTLNQNPTQQGGSTLAGFQIVTFSMTASHPRIRSGKRNNTFSIVKPTPVARFG